MQLLNRWLTTLALSVLLWAGLATGETFIHIHLTRAEAAPLPTGLIAYLPPGNAITDGRALLRYSLPIDNEDIRTLQADLEGLSEWLRSKRWGPVKRDIEKLRRFVGRRQQAILADVPEALQPDAASYLEAIRAGLEPMLAAADNRDSEAIWTQRSQLLEKVNAIEEMMVTEFPFEVPAEYNNLPQLQGRAQVAFETTKGTLLAVIDGYSAPVTGGNFVDLVQRGFYGSLPLVGIVAVGHHVTFRMFHWSLVLFGLYGWIVRLLDC
jgi:peptidylprolyl isomerase